MAALPRTGCGLPLLLPAMGSGTHPNQLPGALHPQALLGSSAQPPSLVVCSWSHLDEAPCRTPECLPAVHAPVACAHLCPCGPGLLSLRRHSPERDADRCGHYPTYGGPGTQRQWSHPGGLEDHDSLCLSLGRAWDCHHELQELTRSRQPTTWRVSASQKRSPPIGSEAPMDFLMTAPHFTG